ncbi:MAG: hypothetical protein JXA54_14055 [Candidatus Heimdallarchaeota archaeon]|nr:hypothetical protein [Candidatus Heimdallarchaeota archaeon]
MQETTNNMALVKFGGSLTERGTKKQIKLLGELLDKIYQMYRNFIIIPGGGIFAETIRKTQLDFNLSDETAHWMAIRAIDIHSLLLQEIIPKSIIKTVREIETPTMNFLEGIPILEVLDFAKNESSLEHTWKMTSDSLACEIAAYLGIKKLIFLKDVDGVIKDNQLISHITCKELQELTTSPLDPLTANLIQQKNLSAFILNGYKLERVEAILAGRTTIATEILS